MSLLRTLPIAALIQKGEFYVMLYTYKLLDFSFPVPNREAKVAILQI